MQRARLSQDKQVHSISPAVEPTIEENNDKISPDKKVENVSPIQEPVVIEKKVKAKFCTNCGYKLGKGDKFCSNCCHKIA